MGNRGNLNTFNSSTFYDVFRKYLFPILCCFSICVTLYNILSIDPGVWHSQFDSVQKLTKTTIKTSMNKNINHTHLCNIKENEKIISVIAGSLAENSLRYSGGTGHWYHMAEYIFPYFKSSVFSYNVSTKETIFFFVFREKYAASQLSSFVRLLLSIVFVNTQFKYIYFLWAEHIIPYDENMVVLDNFHVTFIVDLELQISHNLFTKSSLGNDTLLRYPYIHKSPPDSHGNSRLSVCVHKASDLDWEHPRDRVSPHWFSSPIDFDHFQSTVHRLCKLPSLTAPTTMHSMSPPDANDNTTFTAFTMKPGVTIYPNLSAYITATANVESNLTILHKHHWEKSIADDTYMWANSKVNTEIVPAPVVVGSSKLVLIYQRDHTRTLRNVDEIARRLSHALNDGVGKGTPLSAGWRVEVLMHSEKRPICELVSIMRRATVIFTSHGFQSMLLLFQPKASVLVEIHPFYYVMPHHYGNIQSSLRQFGGTPRSYLYDESPAHGIIMYWLDALRLINRIYCRHSPACRYIARLQDVSLTSRFLDRITHFLHEHFP